MEWSTMPDEIGKSAWSSPSYLVVSLLIVLPIFLQPALRNLYPCAAPPIPTSASNVTNTLLPNHDHFCKSLPTLLFSSSKLFPFLPSHHILLGSSLVHTLRRVRQASSGTFLDTLPVICLSKPGWRRKILFSFAQFRSRQPDKRRRWPRYGFSG